MSDAAGPLIAAVAESRAMRRLFRMIALVLLALAVVNFVALLGVGMLILSDQHDKANQRRAAKAGAQIVGDLYRVANDTNATAHHIDGTPVPAPAVPPVTTTTTTTKPTRDRVARSPGRTASTAPPGANHPSTTEIGPPPPSGAPEPPKPSPSPSTTTTTTQPCTTVPLVGTALCR